MPINQSLSDTVCHSIHFQWSEKRVKYGTVTSKNTILATHLIDYQMQSTEWSKPDSDCMGINNEATL